MAGISGRAAALASILAVTISTGFMGAAHAQTSAAAPNLKLSNDQPIQIESDNLEVDEQKSIATFIGNVNVVQGETNLKSGKMIVHYKNDGKGGSQASSTSSQIERIEVSQKVYLKSGAQVATGDTGNFDMNTNVMTLSGKEVVLSDGANVLRGCKLTVAMDSGKANVTGCGGRVMMLIQPESKPN